MFNLALRFRSCCGIHSISSAQKTLSWRNYSSNPWSNLTEQSVDISFADPDCNANGTMHLDGDQDERLLQLSTGHLARFADGSAVATLGNTSVMVTAVSRESNNPNQSFMPLTVDYREKTAAVGRIPTNYLRRELGPSDREILTSRMIDRSIRSQFHSNFYNDTQIMCNVLAVDGSNYPDILSINAASAALAVSDIPWRGPIGAVRLGLLHNSVIVNPNRQQQAKSQLNMVMAATEQSKVVMFDCSAENVNVDIFKEAVRKGVLATEGIINGIKQLCAQCGKEKRLLQTTSQSMTEEDSAISALIESLAVEKLKEIFTDSSHHKISRDQAVNRLREHVTKQLSEQYPAHNTQQFSQLFGELTRRVFRDLVLQTDIRCDGRDLTSLRHISSSVDLYKPLHGSALFQRGQTQVLCTVALDSPDSSAKVDLMSAIMSGMKEKNFFLHYEFPPYAVNETGKAFVGRRELGHGALAEKSIRPVVPNDYPFTIRLTAEVLESNGSSSMASVCAGSLALMDAGVPVKEAVAGIAIGLISKVDTASQEIIEYKILTDLLGIEDYMGDMDFKMAGTATGITSLQADIKIDGLPLNIVMEAIDRATDGRQQILDIMSESLSTARTGKKENAPILDTLEIPAHQLSNFRGLGGYNLKKLTADTGVSLIPMENNKYQIFAPNKNALDESKVFIENLLAETKEPEWEFGGVYEATVSELREYGVMVQLHPTMQPTLIHNTQLDQKKVRSPQALGIEVGDKFAVKYFGRDPADGKLRLSRKALHHLSTTIIKQLSQKT